MKTKPFHISKRIVSISPDRPIEKWTINLVNEESKSISKEFQEIPINDIFRDALFWATANEVNIESSKKITKMAIDMANSWTDFGEAINLGFSLNSITLHLTKGKVKENINISFHSQFENRHTKIYTTIFDVFKRFKKQIGLKKMTKLKSLRVALVKDFADSGRPTQLRKTLKTKERVFKYLTKIITSINDGFELKYPNRKLLFSDIDINKLLKNYLVKF